jgi:hypothetical protein
VGALFNPKPTFQDIARRPSWVAPALLMVVVGAALGTAMAQRVNWEQVTTQRIDQSSRMSELTPTQRQQAIERGTKFSQVGARVAGPVGVAVAVLIYSGLFLAMFNLFTGADLQFDQSLGIVAHGMLPLSIANILAVVVLCVKDPDTTDPRHPLAADLSAVLPAGAPPWLDALLGSFDLFVFWNLALLVIGFAAANPKKIKLGTSIGIVFGLWAFWLIIKVGVTAMATL